MKHELRQVVNGILYVNKTGCQWRQVPEEFGNWISCTSSSSACVSAVFGTRCSPRCANEHGNAPGSGPRPLWRSLTPRA
ncbi:MAG: transposase [Flavobacteriales bacterium]|nr:transposase [Flavobacteriales bacterium]